MTTLFLGGWHLPFLDRDGLRIAFGGSTLFFQALRTGSSSCSACSVSLGKTISLCWLQLMIRWTLAALPVRSAHASRLAQALPASLVNILLTGLVILIVGR
jgi:NADH-quinone oxidoreductase subunit H